MGLDDPLSLSLLLGNALSRTTLGAAGELERPPPPRSIVIPPVNTQITMADAADDDLVDYDDDDVVDQTAADDKDAKKGHYVGTCVEINECRVHDNSSRSHVASMAWSRCDSARTRRKNLISHRWASTPPGSEILS